MSKELEYEFNNFADLLNKDCKNLMECLKKQDKDNKAILYLGKHFKKVILPYEEYQKMCNRLESIDNSNPSEALMKLNLLLDRANHDEILSRKSIDFCEKWLKEIQEAYDTIKQALLKAQESKKYLKWEDLEFTRERQFIKVKLNNTEYILKYYVSVLKEEMIEILGADKSLVTGLSHTCINDKQFFNDLRLERVKE